MTMVAHVRFDMFKMANGKFVQSDNVKFYFFSMEDLQDQMDIYIHDNCPNNMTMTAHVMEVTNEY